MKRRHLQRQLSQNRDGGQPAPGWAAAAAVFAVALIVRALYLLGSRGNPAFASPVVDAAGYHAMAAALAEGRAPPEPLFWQPVFYPLWLSLVYRLFGPSILLAKCLQAVVGAGCCALVCLIGRRALSARVGLIAGLICAVYGPLVFFETELLGEGWAVFWLLTELTLLLKAQSQPRPSALYGCAGVAAALAVAARPVLLPVFVAQALLIAWRMRKRAGAKRLRPAFLAFALGGFALVAVPLALFNLAETGRFSVLPFSGGINLYIGNNPAWTETVAARPGREWQALLRLPREAGAVGPWERDAFYRRAAAQYARAHPLLFLKGLAGKALRFANSRELARNDDLAVFREWSAILRLLVWRIGGWGFPFGVLLPLACIGLFLQRRSFPAELWSVVLVYPAAVTLYFVSARYRILLIPVLALPAAAALVAAAGHTRNKRPGTLALFAAAAVVLSAATALPLRFPEEREPAFYKAELYRLVGRNAFEAGRHAEAVPLLQTAVRVLPEDAEAWNDLSNALAGSGRWHEADQAAARAVALLPDEPLFMANLGNCRLRAGAPGDAERLFRAALKADPANPALLLNLGLSLARQSRYAEAAAVFAEAVRLAPGWPEARAYLEAAQQAADR